MRRPRCDADQLYNSFKVGQLSLFPQIGRMSIKTRGKGRCSVCGWRITEGHAPICMRNLRVVRARAGTSLMASVNDPRSQ